jgi:anti-sigma factor RsiW
MPKKKPTSHIIGGRQGANCAELLAVLNDYVDGGVNPSVCKALEGHLAQCNPCRVVVDNIRKTITLYRKDEPCELPLAFRDRLHAAIRDCRKAKPVAKKTPRQR